MRRRPARHHTLLVLGVVLAAVIAIIVVDRPSGVTTPTVKAAVSTTTGTRDLGPAFSGFSTDGSAEDYSNAKFFPAVRGLAPENLRGFPAGTGSNYFNWQTGRFFTTAKNLSYIAPDKPDEPDQLSLFTKTVQATKASPVFTLNITTYCPADLSNPTNTAQASASCTPEQACGPDAASYSQQCTNTDPRWGLPFQLRMLRTAKQLGVPIKYVELGNELYSTNDSSAYYFPTVQDYVTKANVWTAAIKKQFPGVRVSLVGFAGTACRDGRTATAGKVTRMNGWNAAVIEHGRGEDALTFHTYYDSGISAPGSITDPSDLATMLSTAAQSCVAAVQKNVLDTLPGDLTAWITEWNLTPTEGVLEHGSWAQGLTEAIYAVGLARLPKVELMSNETLINTQVYGALYSGAVNHFVQRTTRKSVAVPNSTPPTTEPFGRSGGGFALGTFNRSLHGATSTSAVTFTDPPKVSGTDVSGLVGQTFTVGGKRNLFFVNLSSDDVQLDLGTLSGHYSMQQASAAPATFVTSEKAVSQRTDTVTGTVLLNAGSVTSLTSS